MWILPAFDPSKMKHLQLFAVHSQDNVGMQLSKLPAAPMQTRLSHRINTAYCINDVWTLSWMLPPF